MVSKNYKILIAILILVSCKGDPKNEYAKKIKIGICQENQGMVTFEAALYSDSTFYQSGHSWIGYSYGEFKLRKGSIIFKTLGGEKNFCPKYTYDQKSNSYYSDGICASDPIIIFWNNSSKH